MTTAADMAEVLPGWDPAGLGVDVDPDPWTVDGWQPEAWLDISDYEACTERTTAITIEEYYAGVVP